MIEPVNIHTPITDEVVRSLKAGDSVAISGVVFTARDQAHKRLCELLDAGKPLPVDLNGQAIYYVGPTPASDGRAIGAAGPTTSSRMDPFSPMLYEAGLKATIGKGYRGKEVIESLKENCCVHFAAVGGAGALLSRHIVSCEIVAYEELGTEAIRKLRFVDFPAIVAYDCHGHSAYQSK